MSENNGNHAYKTGLVYQGNPSVLISAAGVYLLFIGLSNLFSAGIGMLAAGTTVNITPLILTAAFGVVALVIVVGLFWRRSWAPWGTIIINALNVLSSLIGIVQFGELSLFSVLFMFISTLLVILFYVRDDIKAVFKRD